MLEVWNSHLHQVVLVLWPDTDGVIQDDCHSLSAQDDRQVLYMLLLAVSLSTRR